MLERYVNRKSELSVIKQRMELKGYQVYRTRLYCGCKNVGNRRDGIIIVKNETIMYYVMRCKACVRSAPTLKLRSTRKEADNGSK